MMNCLAAGGMEIAYNKKREAWLNRLGNESYIPNETFFELSSDDLASDDFPAAYDGRAIKVLWNSLVRVPIGEYRVVFMRRPIEELIQSHERTFGSAPMDILRPNFDSAVERIIEVLEDRNSIVTLNELWYGDVMANPRKALEGLGWPIDVGEAAKVPTPDKYRNRYATKTQAQDGCRIGSGTRSAA